eukprot:scaffold658758_cov65-Prasinocladus_malaysianus.AAC.1
MSSIWNGQPTTAGAAVPTQWGAGSPMAQDALSASGAGRAQMALTAKDLLPCLQGLPKLE